jgi:nitrate/nitrite-specific signal transduction histidine kinase
MHGKQRVGQVSLQVIEAARDADALNRAGQLRMLSQRLVKLQALVVAGTDVPAARALLQLSLERCAQQVEHLQRQLSKPTHGDLLQAVQEGFDALRSALQGPADAAGLVGIDAKAEELLDSANHLTNVLQGAGPAGSLHVINVSGRQRMLSQRLAKQVLLAFLLGGDTGRAAQGVASQTVQAFEQALRHLHELPLSSADIRQALADADAQWQRMLQGVRGVASAPGRVELAQASEALLELFERLTESYERSMQVLMG